MACVRFPYGKKMLEYEIPEARLQGVLYPEIRNYVPADTEEALVERRSQRLSAVCR